MAESCSNWKRWRMELRGVEHDADAEGEIGLLRKRRTACGGRPSSSRPKFSRLRPVTNLPFLSVTVKMRLTSLTWTLMVSVGWSDWRVAARRAAVREAAGVLRGGGSRGVCG